MYLSWDETSATSPYHKMSFNTQLEVIQFLTINKCYTCDDEKLNDEQLFNVEVLFNDTLITSAVGRHVLHIHGGKYFIVYLLKKNDKYILRRTKTTKSVKECLEVIQKYITHLQYVASFNPKCIEVCP